MARRVVGWIVPLFGIGLALYALADSTATSAPDSAKATPDSAAATPDSATAPPNSAASKPDAAHAKPDSAAVKRRSPGNPVLGKKIFAVKCVACHRADGSGGIKVTVTPTPDWRNAKRMADPRYDDAYLRDCITNGKPKSGMVAWSKQGVKAGDIENLIAYIRTFSAPKK